MVRESLHQQLSAELTAAALSLKMFALKFPRSVALGLCLC